MRDICRSVVLGAVALAAMLAFGTTSVYAQPNKCHAGKIKCVSKKKSCLLGVEAKARKKGLPPDAAKLQKCKDKFDGGADPAKGCFAKLEAKNDGPCVTFGDLVALENKVDAFVADVVSELDLLPANDLNKCTAGKIKCVSKKDKCVLNVEGKAEKVGLPVDAAKLQKCTDKFDGGVDPTKGCFEKLEAKNDGPCLTFDDTAALETKIDAFDDDVLAELATAAPATCPTQVTFEGTSTDGILDTGWSGQAHDATVVDDGTVSVTVTGCSIGTQPNCGICTYSGPIPNAMAADYGAGTGSVLNSRRCTGNTRTTCSSNVDCAVPGGTCEFYFGTLLPLAAGGVSTCVSNQFTGGLSGTFNEVTGDSDGLAAVLSRVYNGVLLDTPCPICVGDATPNDGLRGGMCDVGQNTAATCDNNGMSPNVTFGSTSLDCPPDPGALIASLPIDLTNTTGNRTRTLSAANPSCRSSGFATLKCQCDTCNTGGAIPCDDNADCPDPPGPTGPICGGRRCAGGANDGIPCALNSECPGGACTVPGTTKPNECDDEGGGLLDDDCGATDTNANPRPNDRSCITGPFEQFCGPSQTHKSCSTNTDCAAGQTCSIGRFRECFDNGIVGDVVTGSGQADPPVAHEADPTLAALFCIAHTNSGAVNAAAGLPGLGRLELTGHATDNGTT